MPGKRPATPAEIEELKAVGIPLGSDGVFYVDDVDLDDVAKQDRLSVDDLIKQREADLREWLAGKVVPAFLTANKWTLIALGVLVVLDEINIAFRLITPSDRIVTSQVLMTLLGATTVQVGAISDRALSVPESV